jgi:curved DNA-binding protein CbpA
LPAKTLYDVLCVSSDDDAEALRSAFHGAVKANHPDLNPDDPDAPQRFRQVVAAYRILRNDEKRSAYDALLLRERARRRAALRRTIVSRATICFAIVISFAGGTTLVTLASRTSGELAKTVGVAPREPTAMATVGAATNVVTLGIDDIDARAIIGRREVVVAEPPPVENTNDSSDGLVRFTSADPQIVTNGAAPEAKNDGPSVVVKDTTAIASTNEAVDAADAGRARLASLETRSDAENAQKKEFDRFVPERGSSLKSLSSSPKNDVIIARPPSLNSALVTGKHLRRRGRVQEPATDNSALRQVALESGITPQTELKGRSSSGCTVACTERPPPLFGVGF